MTNNFMILKDFPFSKNQESIEKYVEEIEKSILQNSFDGLFIKGRLILETILSEFSDLGDEIEKSDLNALIKHFTNMKTVPTKVRNAFYTIKSDANEESHITKKSNKPYDLKKDKYSYIQFLKNIFIVFKYFVIHFSDNWDNSYEKEYEFHSDFYENSKKQEISTISKEDISLNSESLESETKGIFELICSKYSFLIPTYQRSYEWEQNNVEVFLQDINDRKEDKKIHYLGSLAIAIDRENEVLRLIDGQQRITTSLLLIKAMINRFKNSKILVMPKELEDLDKIIGQKYKNKSSSFGDIYYIDKILKGITTLGDKSFTNSNAWKNFKYISEFIEQQEDEEFEEFYTTFVFHFVIAELRFKNDLENEIQIFENLNSKGLELSQWDLIKNYIFKKIETSFLIKNEASIEKMIKDMFELHTNSYFQNKKTSHKEISNFFVIYCRIKYIENEGKPLNDKGKIHKIFQKVWPSKKMLILKNKINSLEMLKEELLNVAKYLSIYLEIKSGNYKHTQSPLFEFKLPIENTSQKDTHYPLMMKAIYLCARFDDFKMEKIENIHKKSLINFIKDIEKYLIRLIVSNNKGQSLSQFFDSCISNKVSNMHNSFINNIRIPGFSNSLPSIDIFQKSLEEKNDWQQTYAIAILKRLEATSQNIDNQRFSIILSSSLEHIFPKKPKKDSYWRIQYKNMQDNEFKKEHSSHINMIGNYMIISKKINGEATNDDFYKKKNKYEKDKESKLINGKFNSGKLMNLFQKDNFNFEDIENRSKQLANLIVPLYKMEFEK